MKIGIMTFWWSNDNYGQQLQLFALQKYLRDRGHDAYLIRYRAQKKKLFHYFLKAMNIPFFLHWIKNRAKVKTEQNLHNRHFDDFRNKYIIQSDTIYKTIKELQKKPPIADAYIVGSDQVWNTFHNSLSSIKMRIQAYFLDFGSVTTKRVSYAASWGINDLPEDFCKEIRPLLSRFSYVSVREKQGIDICKKCGCNDAELVCDPTLLLNADTYRTLYKDEHITIPKTKYIFLYLLNASCEIEISQVYNFAQQKGLSVIYITGNGRIDNYTKNFATIPEWLAFLDNAEYVITNSFHCAVFSTIFHKSFGVAPITGKNIQMNNRFDSLFDLVGTGIRYLKNNDFSILNQSYIVKEIQPPIHFLEALKG